jgi:type VI secretion system secreted protein VgrG
MDDTAGKEKITVHGQHDLNTTIEHDETHIIKSGDRTIKVETGKHTETVKGDTKITIESGKYEHSVATGTAAYNVKGALTEYCDATQATTVKNKITIKSNEADIEVNAATKIRLITGASSIEMTSDGIIKVSANEINIEGQEKVFTGTGHQTVTCDTSQLVLSGLNITSGSDQTNHEIKGSIVKIN